MSQEYNNSKQIQNQDNYSQEVVSNNPEAALHLLKNKIDYLKSNQFREEEPLNAYIQSLKEDHLKEIDTIISTHKDRIFNSDSYIDQESPLQVKRIQQKSVQNLDLLNNNNQENIVGSKKYKKSPKKQKASPTKKSAIWKANNRNLANYEDKFKDHLKVKQEEIINPSIPIIQKDYKPIILKTNKRSKYEKCVDDSDIGTEYSEISDFAFKNSNDILQSFNKVFDKKDLKNNLKQRIKDKKDDEIYVISGFYNQIRSKSTLKDNISKQELLTFLLENHYVLSQYNISPDQLNFLIETLQTKKPNQVSRKELIGLLIDPQRKTLKNFQEEDIEDLINNVPLLQYQPTCILSDFDMGIITDIFQDIDTFGEHVVSLKQFLFAIKKQASDILQKPAVYIKQIEKTLTVSRLFNELEQEMYFSEREEDRKQKQKLNWGDFYDFLKNYQRKNIPDRDKVLHAKRKAGKYEEGDMIDLSKDSIQFIKDVFNRKCNKRSQYFVSKPEFLEQIREQELYQKKISKEIAREKAFSDDIPRETVEQTLNRLSEEADDFIDLDEVIDFFTGRGRPEELIHRYEQFREQQRQQKLALVFKREVSSSPDYEELKKKKKLRKQQKLQEQKQSVNLNQYSKNNDKNYRSLVQIQKGLSGQVKITAPEPFDFDSRDQTKKMSRMQQKTMDWLQEKKEEEDKLISYSYKANKVPLHVKDKNKLAKILEQQEARREEVKKNSKEMTIKNQNPFKFSSRNDGKKIHCFQEEQFLPFMAKEAPWYSAILLLERLKRQKAKKTKENVAKRIQELTDMSNIPPKIQEFMDRLKKKAEDREQNRPDYSPEIKKYRANSVPNFKELHKEFEAKLLEEKAKNKQKITKPTNFKFSQTKRAPKRGYLDYENALMRLEKERVVPRKFNKKPPKFMPAATKKWQAMLEMKQQEEEIKVWEQEEKLQRDEDRDFRRKQFANFVRSSGAIQDNQRELEQNRQNLLNQRQQQEKEWEVKFDKMMTDMMKRVIRRPLLVEAQSQGNYRMDRINRLRQLLGENELIQEEDQQDYDENNENNQEYYGQQPQKQNKQYNQNYNQPLHEVSENQQEYENENENPQVQQPGGGHFEGDQQVRQDSYGREFNQLDQEHQQNDYEGMGDEQIDFENLNEEEKAHAIHQMRELGYDIPDDEELMAEKYGYYDQQHHQQHEEEEDGDHGQYEEQRGNLNNSF